MYNRHKAAAKEVIVDLLVENVEYHIQKIPVKEEEPGNKCRVFVKEPDFSLPGGAIRGGLTRTENLPLCRRRNSAGRRSLKQNSRPQLPSPYQVPGVADRLRGGGREAEGVAPRRRRQRLPKKWEAASGGGASEDARLHLTVEREEDRKRGSHR
nr:hypothetical protein Iba_chr06dCG4630 [Ipomoea batatas]